MPRLRSTHDDKTLASSNRRVASKAAVIVDRLLDRVDAARERGDDKSASFAAKAAQSVALAGGISFDKARLAEDRPTVIHGGDRDAEDIIRSLAALGVVDSTAVEITTPTPALPPARDPLRET